MSAGLMSCVRQSSPPLELTMSSDGPPSSRTTTTSSATNSPHLDDVHSLNTTHKRRRRFHPLRNLRRIFRIGTTDENSLNSSAYRPASEPDQSDDYTQSCGSRLSPPDTPIRVVQSSTSGNAYHNSSSCDSLLYSPTKPHRDARRRHPSTGHYDQHSRGQPKPVLLLRKSRESLYRDNEDTTDFQQRRSISECLGGDTKNESLSQSHDSVFSESVTASSMSIGLKAELSSVLRKKYYDRGSSSDRKEEEDEDLGFPRSPNTPKRGASISASSPLKNMHNMSSDGSLSIMSMGSSELNSTHSPSTKFRLTKSKTEPEEDVVIRQSHPLNHSAARHKMSVRPKKKAPSRMSRIQTVEEVSYESTTLLDQLDGIQEGHVKSSSLPHGVDSKSMHQTEMAKSTILINSPAGNIAQHLYSNRHMSKSFVIESTSSGTNKQPSEPTITEKDKDVNGFFRRLLNRGSMKKNRVPDDLQPAAPLNTIVPVIDAATQTKPKTLIVKPDKPKSGPASRQRVLPREIQVSPQKIIEPQQVIVINNTTNKLPITAIHVPELPPVSPKKPVDLLPPKPVAAPRAFEIRPSRSSSSSKLAFTSGAVARVSSEYQIKLQDEPKSPPHILHRSDEQLFPRYFKHTAFSDTPNLRTIQSSQSTSQVVRSTDSINESPATSASTPTRKPVEKSKSFRFYTETSADSSLQCSVGHMPSLPDLSFTSESSSTTTTTTTNTDSPNHRDLINKFEINDNNLVFSANNKPAKSELTGSRKTVYVTTSCESNSDLTSKSPTKVSTVKLAADTKIITSSSSSNINQIEDNIDRIMKFACVTVLKTPAAVTLPANDDPPSRPALPFSARSLSIEDDPKELRFSNESVEITENLDTETKSTNGVIVERRKSVSDEKLKFERKIQERFRNTVVTESESESRKSSLSDVEATAAGPAVVLRKKSNVLYGARPVTTAGTMPTINAGASSDDQTPELMKVFARRSLKLKDQDDYVVCLEEPVASVKPADLLTDVISMPSTEATPTTSASRIMQKSVSLNATVFPITTKPNATTPLVSRLSGGYNLSLAQSSSATTTTNQNSTNKTVSTALLKAAPLITQTQSATNHSNNNNNNHIQYTHSQSGKANINNNNNNDVVVVKNVSNIKAADDEVNDNHQVATIRRGDEFKGILQRRAEWEKRATQTFK